MPSRVLRAAIVVALGCATARARPAPPTPLPPPQAEVTLAAFEGALTMHGEWIVVGRYGRVWRPLHVAIG